NKRELVLVQMIHILLIETDLFENNIETNIADRKDQKQKIRHFATAVATLWAGIFNKGKHIFDVVNISGASLSKYSESMERVYTPTDQA
ncbi:uncharacterized protein A1O9_00517, partial [Exophiala aquamarina CBS 119918]